MSTGSARYTANLTKASLKVAEARTVARVLLQSPTPEEWKRAVVDENVLRKRSPATSSTLAGLLRQRLETVNDATLRLIAEGDAREATLGTLAATLRHSALLRDFFVTVLGDLHRSFADRVPPSAWGEFIRNCEGRDPSVARWTPPVVDKMRQNVHRMLAESGYVADTRSLRLQAVYLPPTLESALAELGDNDLIGTLRLAQR